MTTTRKTAFAKHLRRKQTSAEALIWAELRGRRCGGYKFRRQAPIGTYVVDFLCVAQKLIVEIDDPSHLETVEYDANRTHILENQGYHVIRLTNEDVYEDLDATIEAIWQALENARPKIGGLHLGLHPLIRPSDTFSQAFPRNARGRRSAKRG